MKKMPMIIFIIITLALLMCMTACTVDIQTADPKVVKISVDGISKTEYVACDKLDLTGATVIATYDNKDVVVVPLVQDMLDKSSFNMDERGEYRVKVVYEGQSTFFTITVSEWKLLSVELASVPYVTEYVVGEDIDTSGATILCTFEGNKTQMCNVTPDMLQSYNDKALGRQTIKFTYYGVEMSFDVTFTEKTPTAIKIVNSATNNYVYKGLGDRFDMDGMTVKITYDNAQIPEFTATDIKSDLSLKIKDDAAGTVTAVLMYYPSEYKSEYVYTYYGSAYVAKGDMVKPNQELAGNKIFRDDKEIALDAIVSKSYGTVSDIAYNDDGTQTMTVITDIAYSLTEVAVSVGEIIDKNNYIGKRGTEAIYSLGGGVVESINNGVIVIKTAPTTSFTSNVKNKSFVSMEILDRPQPEKYFDITSIDNMIQGDNINRSTGRVRVYFDDDSVEDFRMNEDNYIRIVNSGAESVNQTLDISKAGRHELWITYGGVLTNRVSLWVTVDSKYPTQLIIEEKTNTISGKTFYFGDTISIATMRYYVVFNNETESEKEQLTEDMLGENCSFYCKPASNAYSSKIFFTLPSKYSALIPADEGNDSGEIRSAVFNYTVAPQPITGISFMNKPTKVYVSSVNSISFEAAKLNVYYRNNTYVTLDELNALPSQYVQVDDWADVDAYEPDEADSGERMVIFTLNGNDSLIDISNILKGNGYEAKIVYFDGNGSRSNTVSFDYYLMNAEFEVSTINVILTSSGGIKGYKDEYSQYEDWNLGGIDIEVNYKNTMRSDRISATPDMIYDGNTDELGQNISVKFSYMGATDDSTFKISVGKRKPTGIILNKQGKTEYLDTYSTSGGIDFSNYSFTLAYNAGPNEPINGLRNIRTEERSSGWWYKMYNSRGETIELLDRVGTVIFELYYSFADDTNEKGYSYISTPLYATVKDALTANPEAEEMKYTVSVVENTYSITSISYDIDILADGVPSHNVSYLNSEDGMRYLNENTSVKAMFPSVNGLSVLAEVAAGWEIMLSEYVNGVVQGKVITVNYIDAENNPSVGYVKITKEMLDYDILDTSTGYRRVTVTYKNISCETYVYVWKAELTAVDVFITPLQNYINAAIHSEDDLVLNGGILKLTFTKHTRNGQFAGYMYKYIDMRGDDITYSGFINGLYSKEGEDIVISIMYKDYEDLKTSYVITVYDKQDVTFSYTNTIFFYGNVSDASFSAKQYIDEFDLPTDITLTYVATANFITTMQYLALSETERKAYAAVTTYDDEGKLVRLFYVKRSDIKSGKYIDPAAGTYYVKYGNVAIADAEDYANFSDADKRKFFAVIDYDNNGKAIDTIYYTTDSTVTATKLVWHQNVIIDKLTAEEYARLSEAEKVNYEAVANGYYILMRVVDDRPENMRYYETANYALQTYTIIQKVIDVSVVSATNNAKLLRVSTWFGDDNSKNGNPYAILYLLNSITLTGIYNPSSIGNGSENYMQSFMSDILITSPNESYFEILVLLKTSYEGTNEQDEQIAEVFYQILSALTSNKFIEGIGVQLTKININYGGSECIFSSNAVQKATIKNRIIDSWHNGVNVFDESTNNEISNRDYMVTYSIPYGETLTRNGILQLLSGALRIDVLKDDEENVIGYSVSTGTLGHSSYTIDLTSNNIIVE